MKYEYRDTFIKKCSSTNGIGKCERSRETVKCIDDLCTKVSNPKDKKDVLQEYYASLSQDGSGPDPSLKKGLLKKLKEKYRCPYCKEYKYTTSLLEHLDTHKGLTPKKRQKTLSGGCGSCMIGGSDSEATCPFCKKSTSMHSLIKHLHSHKEQPSKDFLVGGCAACMVGGQSGGGKNDLHKYLIHNLKTKYRCPICKKYKHIDDMDTHMNKYHVNGPKSTPLTGVPKIIEDMNKLSLKAPEHTLSGSGIKQFYGKKSSVMVKIPTNVKNTAVYAFRLRKMGFKGGKDTGWKRAKQLATKDSIAIEDLKYMRAWFARHIYTSYPSYKLWQKAGRPKDIGWHNKHGIVSWLIWGGDSAFKWVNSTKNIKLLNQHYPSKNYKQISLKSKK